VVVSSWWLTTRWCMGHIILVVSSGFYYDITSFSSGALSSLVSCWNYDVNSIMSSVLVACKVRDWSHLHLVVGMESLA
jgi:hypothetical protein